jgi:hypothetical protein
MFRQGREIAATGGGSGWKRISGWLEKSMVWKSRPQEGKEALYKWR